MNKFLLLVAFVILALCALCAISFAYNPTPPPASPPCLQLGTPWIDNPGPLSDKSVSIRIWDNTGPTFVCIAGNSNYGGFVNRWFQLGPEHRVQGTNIYSFVFSELDGLTWYTIYAYDQYHGVRTDSFWIGL